MPTNTADIELCQLALMLLALPLGGFVIQIFFGSRLPRQGDWVPTLAILGSFGIACYLMLSFFGAEGGVSEAQRWYPELGRNWINLADDTGGGFVLHFGVQIDNLTIIMLFVVTLVSFLVHLYSCGYMHGEVRYSRFFAFLGLFSFSMLGLCMASNLLFLFIFWELVGVCSYFLIGFYFEKKSAQNAAIKAFITTGIGDLGLFLAILIIAAVVPSGSLEFSDIFASVERGAWTASGLTFFGLPLLTFAGICLFLGPIGKSAQFPLHVWLPDAMEGPTPVSALIHAATMVVAGVYLVARMFPFLAGEAYFQGDFWNSDPLFLVALVGGFTAFFAATIAFAQTDIKKVLAYSTVSQLGYMMLGLGVGSVTAGIFHLTTHAFFKALLFLGSGSVIHAVHSNEMQDMGGLRKKLPITWITFAIGTLAIAGLPFLSGFYSKEAILGNAYAFGEHRGGVLAQLPFFFGMLTAGMTCFYMFRMFFKTFHGQPLNRKAYDHAHESPWTMTAPLCILAVLAVIGGGILGTDTVHWFENRVESTILVPPLDGVLLPGSVYATVTEEATHASHGIVQWLSLGMFAGGLALAVMCFTRFGLFYRKNLVAGFPLAPLHTAVKKLWFIDAFFTWFALRTLQMFNFVCGAFDAYIVDGFVNFWGTACRFVTGVVGAVDYHGVDGTVRGIGEGTLWSGRKVRQIQTGMLQQYVYASMFLFAGIFLIAFFVYVISLPDIN